MDDARTPLDDRPVTATFPAYVWAYLRGAAREGARRSRWRARNRATPLPREDALDLNEHRACVLTDAAGRIDALLRAPDDAA